MHRTPAPTDEELEAVPTSDAEEVAMAAAHRRLLLALDRGRIPADLTWAYVMISLAATTLAICGMPADWFVRFGDYVWTGDTAEEREGATRPPATFGNFEPPALKARARRVLAAMLRAKVPLDEESAILLVSHASRICIRHGVPQEAFHAAAAEAYRGAEQGLAAMAARPGAPQA